MSGRFSRGRRYFRSRSYKAWPKRSALIRRSVGNMRAAKRQNDLSNTTLSGSSLSYIITVPADGDFGYQSFNIWNALNYSPMFRTLKECYDQIRINNVKVKFSLLQALTMTGSNCPVFATVWDRNGFHPDQYHADTTDYMDGSNLDWEWETFASYSSFEKRSMSSGSAFNATVSISPSNMAEKSMYVSTKDITDPSGSGNDSSEICSPLSNPALPFKPQIVTGIYVAKAIADQAFIFSVDWEVDVSFRGMHASTGQATANVESITHFLPSGSPPHIKFDMVGAQKMSSMFSEATDPITLMVPVGGYGILIQYNSLSDVWHIVFIRNPSGSSDPITFTSSGPCYHVVATGATPSYVYFGKGSLSRDKIILGCYADSSVNGDICQSWVSGKTLHFDFRT